MHLTRREPAQRRTKESQSLMSMRKVALSMLVTLDDFFEGSNHGLIAGHPRNGLRPTARRVNPYSPRSQNILK
jgi:hypothetical protein